jgi:hypothetical protein
MADVPAAALPSWPRSTNPTAPGRPVEIPPAGREWPPSRLAGRLSRVDEGEFPPERGEPGGSARYEEWARQSPPAEPSGPPVGRVYGGPGTPPPPTMTAAFSPGNPENTGSLTGHILGYGDIEHTPPTSRTKKVVVAMLLIVGLLVVTGLIVAAAAGDLLSNLFGG